MNVTATTTIRDLVDAYPYLLDWLVSYNSHFEALKNPALFTTMARVAKVDSAAQMAGVPADEMLDAIRTEIARREIVAEETAGGPAEPVDPEVAAARQEALKDVKPSAQVASGHPLDAYKRENEVATRFVADVNLALGELATATDVDERVAILATISEKLGELSAIETHYTRKENQLFPVLETHGIEGPTKVMWALDDDIRGRLKTARTLVDGGDAISLASTLPETMTMIDDMIYKEEKILFPTSLDVVTVEEWATIAAGDAEIGYAWIEGPGGEAPVTVAPAPEAAGDGGEMLLPLPTGALTLGQLDLLFCALPFDVTYVDENDRVRFYSEGERVFPRSPGAIGREVRNCHPPKSLHKVEEILAAFKSGDKDTAEFWIEMGPKFVHIRYSALRDEGGAYKGCLEVVHDATHVRSLSGNRRIVDW